MCPLYILCSSDDPLFLSLPCIDQMGKMKVRDEVRDVDTFAYLTFVDFMEVLCRIASMKNTPSDEDLQVRKKESDELLLV